MTRCGKVQLVLSVLFVLVNLGGAGWAAMHEEWVHTGIHIALVFAGEYVVWRLLSRRAARV